jgi:hypothetical protein
MEELHTQPQTLGAAFELAMESLDSYMCNLGKENKEEWTYTTPFEVSVKDGHLVVFVRGKTKSSETDRKIGIKVGLIPTELQARALLDGSN